MDEPVIVRELLARRLREEAGRLGMSSEEYLVELLSRGLDPKERAVEYVEAAEGLLEEARVELGKGDVRRAAEKLWGAVALAVKAYAWWREGKRLSSHGELWEYKRRLGEELGEWVHDAWAKAAEMHICFYEGWCTERDVEAAIKRVEKLVSRIAGKIRGKSVQ